MGALPSSATTSDDTLPASGLIDHQIGDAYDAVKTVADNIDEVILAANADTATMALYAGQATDGATTATTKATEASSSAAGALTSKNAAAASATAAEESNVSAGTHDTNANASEAAAAASATAADASKTAAAASATAADASKTAAAGSATAAANSATAAANSKTGADTSAAAAATSANNADTSETNAATSASAAAASQAAAATSATNAADSATAADNSEAASAASASAAATSETNAAQSAAAAASSASKTILNGSGAPAAGLGDDGEFYIDNTAHDLYGPKTAGAWGAPTSLIGPAGTTTDGDKGDIVVSGAGTGSEAWTVQSAAGAFVVSGELTADTIKSSTGRFERADGQWLILDQGGQTSFAANGTGVFQFFKSDLTVPTLYIDDTVVQSAVNLTVPDEVYGVGWDADLTVPTKNAVYDKINALETTIDSKVSTALLGAADGVAQLDSGGKVPAAQLPSYVDDTLEYANLAAFPGTGTASIIYVALDTNKVYRWSGSAYTEISPSPGSTDAVTEGATNLYFTNARASSAVAADLALKAALAGATFTGKVNAVAPTATGAGLNVGYGAAPTSNQVNGDIWSISTGLYFRVNNSNFQVVTTGTLNSYGHLTAGANFTGALQKNGVDVSVVGHTHTSGDITGLGTAATKNISVGTAAPGSPAVNDLWVDTN